MFICTGHITSYLACNVLPVLLVLRCFDLIVDIICIDPITSYLARIVHSIFHIYSYSVNDWCNNCGINNNYVNEHEKKDTIWYIWNFIDNYLLLYLLHFTLKSTTYTLALKPKPLVVRSKDRGRDPGLLKKWHRSPRLWHRSPRRACSKTKTIGSAE